jgi:hypothetical protein
MDKNKISFVKHEVLKSCRGVGVVTDKAIVNVLDNFDEDLSLRDVERVNKSLVIPIHRRTANRILNAGKDFDRMIVKKILLLA